MEQPRVQNQQGRAAGWKLRQELHVEFRVRIPSSLKNPCLYSESLQLFRGGPSILQNTIYIKFAQLTLYVRVEILHCAP